MEHFTATEAKQSFATVLDAAQRRPVVIRRQKRDIAVVMSCAEYEKLTQLNIEEFQRFCDEVGKSASERGLTEDTLNKLLRNE